MAMLMLLRRMGRGDLTAHGFRSSFRDWAAERTTFPAEVAEMPHTPSATRWKRPTAAATCSRSDGSYPMPGRSSVRRRRPPARSCRFANRHRQSRPCTRMRGHLGEALCAEFTQPLGLPAKALSTALGVAEPTLQVPFTSANR